MTLPMGEDMVERFTPGPWGEIPCEPWHPTHDRAQSTAYVGIGPSHTEHVALVVHVGAADNPTFDANIRLIAAAPDLIEPAPDAADILEHYAEYIRTVKADELERHPYLPLIEDTAAKLRAAITAALGGEGR